MEVLIICCKMLNDPTIFNFSTEKLLILFTFLMLKILFLVSKDRIKFFWNSLFSDTVLRYTVLNECC